MRDALWDIVTALGCDWDILEHKNPASLSPEQLDFAIFRIAEWVDIKQTEESAESEHIGISSADVDHSSLLRRLLSGKKALPTPPPRSFSYPDYDLAEGKKIQFSSQCLFEFGDQYPGDFQGRVSLMQCSEYIWHDKEKQILKHIPTEQLYQITKEESEEGEKWFVQRADKC